MGYWKEKQLRDEERGWSDAPDKYVCDRHLDDDYLRELVASAPDESHCDYCDRVEDEPFAIHLQVLVEEVAGVIAAYWEDAVEFVPWDGGEGGWQWSASDIRDVLDDEFSWYFEDGTDLAGDLFECFLDREIASRSLMVSTTEQKLRFGWRQFVQLVTHETRYLFQTPKDTSDHYSYDEEVPPWEMLDRVGDAVRTSGLVKQLDAGSTWYRGRPHTASEVVSNGRELGTAPVDRAYLSNRMSPAGIPMFYGAREEQTARLETQQPKYGLTTGRFTATQILKVVDFTAIPELPSFFDLSKRQRREVLRFMQQFVEEMGKPVARDGHEHVDYVPTQIVTEYFRRQFGPDRIDGLLYPSVQDPGGVACVLFVENAQCGDLAEDGTTDPKIVLAFDKATLKTYGEMPDPSS